MKYLAGGIGKAFDNISSNLGSYVAWISSGFIPAQFDLLNRCWIHAVETLPPVFLTANDAP
jgi:hypothetical protein